MFQGVFVKSIRVCPVKRLEPVCSLRLKVLTYIEWLAVCVPARSVQKDQEELLAYYCNNNA